jgi:hypothetical protein
MKMDRMVKRENFYGICVDTLEKYFSSIGIPVCITTQRYGINAFAYAYERLNAIISKKPSKKVIDFLKTEYRVKGNPLLKLLVKLYLTGVFHTKGIIADTVFISVPGGIEMPDMLIYPCSRKIRVFHFDKGVVDVIVKSGFPDHFIKREIEFRQRHHNLHIEPVLCHGDDLYREKIIDGKPLARITDSWEYEALKNESMNILKKITKKYEKTINSSCYINRLIEKIRSKAAFWRCKKFSCRNTPDGLAELIKEKLSFSEENIPVTLSHGDFHHGNIWVENSSRRIVIIDWESYGYRSKWYDKATLYGGLRETCGACRVLRRDNLLKAVEYLQCPNMKSAENILLLVLLEDIVFRLDELESMPHAIGMPDLENYCKNVAKGLEKQGTEAKWCSMK